MLYLPRTQHPLIGIGWEPFVIRWPDPSAPKGLATLTQEGCTGFLSCLTLFQRTLLTGGSEGELIKWPIDSAHLRERLFIPPRGHSMFGGGRQSHDEDDDDKKQRRKSSPSHHHHHHHRHHHHHKHHHHHHHLGKHHERRRGSQQPQPPPKIMVSEPSAHGGGPTISALAVITKRTLTGVNWAAEAQNQERIKKLRADKMRKMREERDAASSPENTNDTELPGDEADRAAELRLESELDSAMAELLRGDSGSNLSRAGDDADDESKSVHASPGTSPRTLRSRRLVSKTTRQQAQTTVPASDAADHQQQVRQQQQQQQSKVVSKSNRTSLVVVATESGSLHVVEFTTFRLIFSDYDAMSDSIVAMEINTAETRMLVADSQGHVKMYDITSANPYQWFILRRWTPSVRSAFTGCVYVELIDAFVSSSDDGELFVWTPNGQQLARFGQRGSWPIQDPNNSGSALRRSDTSMSMLWSSNSPERDKDGRSHVVATRRGSLYDPLNSDKVKSYEEINPPYVPKTLAKYQDAHFTLAMSTGSKPHGSIRTTGSGRAFYTAATAEDVLNQRTSGSGALNKVAALSSRLDELDVELQKRERQRYFLRQHEQKMKQQKSKQRLSSSS
eukprot:TRINITY_DN66284_c4_g9_i1.p1 TRINITY_DN66284_c4_g9~~TRINITY_DN66284_c4_g9_i1.p1  ORF type:complete len:617 (+),score=268.49 TRINITY_DN66284_c4_g9_i1:3-1853(+)